MRRVILLACAFLALGLPASGPARGSSDLSHLVARVETGLVFVRADCKGGSHTGTGFLVGPRLVMTARHIVQAEPKCVVTVRQLGSGTEAHVPDWTTWFTRTRADTTRTDLSVLHLAQPIHGYTFPLAATAPKIGDGVVALGYAYAEALRVAQGQVESIARRGGVPEIDAQLSGTRGGEGGPVLNLSGQVVGLVQRDGAREIESVELAAFLGTDHHGLCQGVARTTPSTLCGTTRAGGGASSSAVYGSESFTLRYPSGWKVLQSEHTTVFDPAHPRWLLQIGQRAPLKSPAGMHEVSRRRVEFAGYSALRREVTVPQAGVVVRKVDISFTDSAGDRWDVLLQAPNADWAAAAPRLQAAAAAVHFTT